MNTQIANYFRDTLLTPLNWTDLNAGLIKEFIQVKTVERDGKQIPIRKIFPVSCELTNDQCISNSKYLDLVPNTSRRSIAYFEDQGCRFIDKAGSTFNFSGNMRLVCWVNGKKFDYNLCSISAFLIGSILSKVPSNPDNSGDFTKIKITSIKEVAKDSRIFAKYNYDESVRQYLMNPFDYFALDLEYTFSADPYCFEEIKIKNDNCPTD